MSLFHSLPSSCWLWCFITAKETLRQEVSVVWASASDILQLEDPHTITVETLTGYEPLPAHHSARALFSSIGDGTQGFTLSR